MKMREWLRAGGPLGEVLAETGGGLDYFTTLLDAEVIGLPDTEAPVYVIAPEAWEAAREAVMDKSGYIGPWNKLAPLHKGRIKAVVRAALQVILPDARVAERIVEVPAEEVGVVTGENAYRVAAAPCEIAILAKQEEE